MNTALVVNSQIRDCIVKVVKKKRVCRKSDEKRGNKHSDELFTELIFYRLMHCKSWKALPVHENYPTYKTVNKVFIKWCGMKIFEDAYHEIVKDVIKNNTKEENNMSIIDLLIDASNIQNQYCNSNLIDIFPENKKKDWNQIECNFI